MKSITSFKVGNSLNLTREVKSKFILANKRFYIYQTKTMISRALETKNILTKVCPKHNFPILKKHSAFCRKFTNSNSLGYYRQNKIFGGS